MVRRWSRRTSRQAELPHRLPWLTNHAVALAGRKQRTPVAPRRPAQDNIVVGQVRAGISVGPQGFAGCGQKLFSAHAQRFDAGHGRCCSWING